MSSQFVVDLSYRAILVALKLSAPVLLTAMILGILINIVQTVTSIRDQSLTFVPKVLGAAAVLSFTLPWSLQVMSVYLQEMYMLFGAVAP